MSSSSHLPLSCQQWLEHFSWSMCWMTSIYAQKPSLAPMNLWLRPSEAFTTYADLRGWPPLFHRGRALHSRLSPTLSASLCLATSLLSPTAIPQGLNASHHEAAPESLTSLTPRARTCRGPVKASERFVGGSCDIWSPVEMNEAFA